MNIGLLNGMKILLKICESACFGLRRVPVPIFLSCLLLFSLLLKILCWYLEPAVSRDGCLYMRLAQSWYDTGVYPAMITEYEANLLPPFLLYLMKCLIGLGFSAEIAGVTLNIVLGSFTPLLAYGIAYEILWRKDIAICSAILTAVNPSMNKLAIEVQRDMIYLFFIGLTLWLLLAAVRRKQYRYWLIGGLVCGCSMLTRFETLEILLIVPISLIILTLERFYSWKKAVCDFGLFLLFFLISVSSLSFLMKTQDNFVMIYKTYYLRKIRSVQKQFIHAGKERSEK